MNEDALHELPAGWVWARLGDILEIVRGVSFPKETKIEAAKDGYVACLRTANVQKEVDWNDVWFIPYEFVRHQEQYLQPYDILISTANSLELVGKVSQAKTIQFPATLGAFISLIRVPPKFNPTFIYFQLSSFDVQSKFRFFASTTTNISNLSTTKLKAIELKIPPLPEQRAIASKIEQLFSDLDNGIENFKRAQAQLKRYRQSVLKAACEGKLVPTEAELAHAEGREYEAADVLLARILKERRSASEKNGKDAQYKVQDTNGLPGLPEGWRWVESNMICKTITDGDHQPPPQSEEGIPFLVISNIKEGKLDFSKTRFVPEYYYQSIQEHRIPKKGDILYSVVGSYGIPAMVDVDRNFCFQRHIALLKPNEFIYNKYLLLALKSDFTFRQATAFATGTAQLTVSLSGLRQIKIPLPPLAEQRRIVSEVERRLSISDKMEAIITESLQKAESLRQSVLKKAFEGKLLNEKELEEARDAPDWEPAEKLLEKIRQEKEIKGKNKRNT